MARILVIEDDPGTRDLVARVLTRAGHEVQTATDGREGIRRLEVLEFDVVITDINMPGMDGIELITTVRKRRIDVPVIAISGGGLIAKEFLLSNAAALGAFEVVSKPFAMGQLLGAVDRTAGHLRAAIGDRDRPVDEGATPFHGEDALDVTVAVSSITVRDRQPE